MLSCTSQWHQPVHVCLFNGSSLCSVRPMATFTTALQHDVIPRASLASFEALRREMLDSNWEDELTSEVALHRLCQIFCVIHKLMPLLHCAARPVEGLRMGFQAAMDMWQGCCNSEDISHGYQGQAAAVIDFQRIV